MNEATLLWALHIVAQVAVVMRILLRRYREPASRVANEALTLGAGGKSPSRAA